VTAAFDAVGRDAVDVVDHAAGVLGAIAQRDVPLGPMTTYRVGGAAALFARPRTVDDLHAIASAHRDTGLPLLVVGRGSNLLVADDGFRGIALTVADLDADIAIDGTRVRAGGAVVLPVLARRTVASSLTGFEWAVGVPGTVGGGVRMNAGGHGSDMAACLVEVDLFDLERSELVTLPASALGMRFRGSAIGDHQLVVSAVLQLASGDQTASEAELDEIVRWRREHQPGGQNAGSVFVNPVPGEVAAGALIDGLGLRGFAIGTAHVSDKHANFIQGTEGGTAADVRRVVDAVRTIVAERTGHLLRSEVRLVGFDDDLSAVPGDRLHAGVTW
jgi:UDP-N-acetylmuramate dehydrogenase